MTAAPAGRASREERRRRGRLVAALLAHALNPRRPPVDLNPTDFDAILPLLVRSGAGPLAWWALRDTGLRADARVDELADLFRMQELRSVIANADLATLLDDCHSRGIDPILGKGWAVARCYRSPGLRPYGDFDIYAPVADFEDLSDITSRLAHVLRTAVDLHRGASYLDDRTFSVLRARSRVVPVAQTWARIYGPEDALRLACLHMLAEGAIRPPWLCDVAVMLSRLPETFDWDYFTSGDLRRTEWTFVALRLAHEVLGTDLSRVPGRFEMRELPAWVTGAVFELWGQGPLSKGNRAPVRDARRSPTSVIAALSSKWPNPIEATVGVRGRFSRVPRLPYQIADAARRSGRIFG